MLHGASTLFRNALASWRAWDAKLLPAAQLPPMRAAHTVTATTHDAPKTMRRPHGGSCPAAEQRGRRHGEGASRSRGSIEDGEGRAGAAAPSAAVAGRAPRRRAGRGLAMAPRRSAGRAVGGGGSGEDAQGGRSGQRPTKPAGTKPLHISTANSPAMMPVWRDGDILHSIGPGTQVHPPQRGVRTSPRSER